MTIETEILQVLHYHPLSNRGAIASMLVNAPSDSTMKRLLADAVSKGLIEVYGKGPATKYSLTPQAQVTMPLDIDTYFKNEMDDRTQPIVTIKTTGRILMQGDPFHILQQFPV